MSTGTCSIHSWNDGTEDDESEIGMNQCVNDKLVPDSIQRNRPGRASSVSRRSMFRSRAVERDRNSDDEGIW